MTEEQEELYNKASAEVAHGIFLSAINSTVTEKEVRKDIRECLLGAYGGEFAEAYGSFLQLNQRKKRNIVHEQVVEHNNKFR